MKTPAREMVARAEEARAIEGTKTARLRGLQLAEETADREAALQPLPLALDASATLRRQAHEIRKPPFRGVL